MQKSKEHFNASGMRARRYHFATFSHILNVFYAEKDLRVGFRVKISNYAVYTVQSNDEYNG